MISNSLIMNKLTLWLCFSVYFVICESDFSFSMDEDLSDVIEAEIEDSQIFRVPQFDGTFKMMTEQEAKLFTIHSEINERSKNFPFFTNKQQKVRFLLHTQKNVMKWQEIHMDIPETLHRSNFNSSHPTRFLVFGIFLLRKKM